MATGTCGLGAIDRRSLEPVAERMGCVEASGERTRRVRKRYDMPWIRGCGELDEPMLTTCAENVLREAETAGAEGRQWRDGKTGEKNNTGEHASAEAV